jgi:DNA-binding Lrp family transcriptional regulator
MIDELDAKDRALLNEIQTGFPVEAHPYRALGLRLGMTADEVLERIASLKARGVIRRMGASINSRGIGFVSTLLAARVSPERFDDFVSVINSFQGVTHNYERNHEYNVWFTLISPSEEEKRRAIDEMIERTGVPVRELPALKIFKIRVDFRF